MAANPDLEAEQAHLDHAYHQLEAMRAAARGLLGSVLDQGPGGTFQARAERDVMVRTSLQRLQHLDIGDQSLCFGRIDVGDGDVGDGDIGDGDIFHIGRLAVSGPDQESLVVDWRAPVAEPFYRATGHDPMGLTLRRHFLTEGRRMVGMEDERFGAGAGPSSEEPESELAGGGVLLAALERRRSGYMRDIVATVQREQDEVIRSPLAGTLVVQGGPGTGKTAVALHRAAYLLYTHRFPLESQGVLVVGPNPVFMGYIERVLPSLGETGVVQTTIAGLVTAGLVSGGSVQASEPPSTAALKGDARMAAVLARAVKNRQRPLRLGVDVPFGSAVLHLSPEDSARVVATARRRGGTHNARRRLIEQLVAGHLHAQYTATVDRSRRRMGTGVEAQVIDQDELGRQILRHSGLAEALDRMWPRLLPEELLHDLYGSPPLIALASRGILNSEEQGALYRPRSPDLGAIGWTPGDLALLDESRALLGSPRRRPTAEDVPRTYGHIVADEAQDLSPMQLRMLGRRSLSGSMTVVGDIAQATGVQAPADWQEVVAHLGSPGRRPGVTAPPGRRPETGQPGAPRYVELSVNYRTPAEVMDLAGRVLTATGTQLRPPRSIRSTGSNPNLVTVAREHLDEEVVARARSEVETMAGGTVAVVAAPSLLPGLARAMFPVSTGECPTSTGAATTEPGAPRHGIGSPLTLVPVELVKGLEFDSVIVVEPALLVAEATGGLRSLYVALTRPTRSLTVVHAMPLPPPLSDPGADVPRARRVG